MRLVSLMVQLLKHTNTKHPRWASLTALMTLAVETPLAPTLFFPTDVRASKRKHNVHNACRSGTPQRFWRTITITDTVRGCQQLDF